jgi:REP element-mobilizing transposase RayT
MLLAKIIGCFKMQTGKRINEIRNSPGEPVWQRNYYEHIIRNEDELNKIREYIATNPLRWGSDRYNPDLPLLVRDEHGRLTAWEES